MMGQPVTPRGEWVTGINVFDRVERLCDQWERNAGPLPPDARHLLRKMVRRVVLDAARLCDLRGQPGDKNMSLRNEARKCADAVRFFLLAGENETVCIPCDGEGCRHCSQSGIRRLTP